MKRRFTAQLETTQRDLVTIIKKMGATSLQINQDILKGAVEIIFDREGQRYVFRCSKYPDALDNLRAAQLTITYLWRAVEEYGVTSEQQTLDRAFAQFFLGFAATPDDTVLLLGSGAESWWDVLGVPPDADEPAIRNAYRALARAHHPDAGGDAADFRRLQDAYRRALAEAAASQSGRKG
jgi:DnaJ-domain-containing protein 1